MKKLITILGPTASGKTAIATQLAARLHGEILSADSRQVYRRMDIGTGKDLSDYTVTVNKACTVGKQSHESKDSVNSMTESQQIHIPYHLIDICEPGTKYNLFQYQQDFLNAYNDIQQRGVQPILCGGTGLYIESVLKGYQLSPVPQNEELRQKLCGLPLDELSVMLQELKKQTGSCMHNKTDVDTCQRAIRAIEIETYNIEHPTELRQAPAIHSLIIGVDIDRELRREKITRRLKTRLDEGMVDEIKGLLNEGIPAEDLIYYGLEYKFLTQYCMGQLSYEEMFRQLEIAIHQFAKRQMTWFRGMERRGFVINWIQCPKSEEEMNRYINNIIKLHEEDSHL